MIRLELPIVSGESLGGWVTAWAAAHHPARVRGAILNTPGNIAARPEVMTTLRESSVKAGVDAAARPESVRARVEWLFHDTSLVTDEIVDVRRTIYTQPGYVRTMENTVALQDPEVRRPYHWDPSWLGRIQCPTLVMWTSHDPTGTIDEGKVLGDWIPGAQLTVIDDAGHWPQWEKVDEFDQLHVDFLARLRAEGR
ncbi:alpha/beta fold hydrolase [Pseudonocardia nigra]|uniref:alpha/beta fold hydrolase n=1 Tax=Pseudonocardia nigra TaxID=1921578 RepID=UPI001C5F7765|nr:alpha/beta hydrolase [Pseudonocardia nigra]